MEPVGFAFSVPITKAFEENGCRYFEGVGSDTRVDRQRQRLSGEAVAKLAGQALEKQIGVKAEHRGRWTDEFAAVVATEVLPDGSFFFRARLEKEHPEGEIVWGKLQTGKKLGASIEGRLIAAHAEDAGDGPVEVIDDLEIDALVITPRPANPRTWVAAVVKSLAPERAEKRAERAPAKGCERDGELAKSLESLDERIVALAASAEALAAENRWLEAQLARITDALERIPVRKGIPFAAERSGERGACVLATDEYKGAPPQRQREMLEAEMSRLLGSVGR